MKFGSLFSGIGGFDLGFERAGMECAWQVEIDPFCQKVLEKHWPKVRRYGDVKEVGKQNLEHVALICGGFPCQPHSVAGKRQASEDERDLWPEFFRIICELRPEWVVAENVRGLLSSETGRFFGGVLKDLATCGYDAEWQVLSAAAFGAPHIRERVFIVANLASQRERTISISTRRPHKKSINAHGIFENVSNINRQGLEIGETQTHHTVFPIERRDLGFRGETTNWRVEPDLARMVSRVPNRVDRIKGLGNAVVPQIAEWIGKRIMEVDDEK